MRHRIVVLLILTVICGVIAAFVGKATAGKNSVRAAVPRSTQVHYGPCPLPNAFRPAFEKAAHETKLPLAMLVAVARVESEFEPNARSSAGAHGLLQILPSTAKELKLDTSTPEKNVMAGARYLRILLDEFQSTELALAAYNAGPTAVAKAGRPPTKATQAYVDEITRLWRSFNGCR